MSEADAVGKACLHWLARREHSRAELVQKLDGAGFDEVLIGRTLDRLAEEGLQSDRRFLESFVRSRFAKGVGPSRIRHELKCKGLAVEELGECLAGYDWDEAMEKVHAKKYGDTAAASPRDYASRVRFLLQRGFEQDRVKDLLKRLGRGDD